jgi:predicted N-acetyltransferase YhbS
MSVTLRKGAPADAEACGRIVHEAFTAIANQHNFPSDFPSPESGIRVTSMMLSQPGRYAVVAEQDGRIIGSNFLDERSTIAGLGPITIDPAGQDAGVGRQLMQAVLDRATERRYAGVRLLQDTYNNKSFALYVRLGFQVRDAVSMVQGSPIRAEIPGCTVRPADESDLDPCNRVCTRVHGHDRGGQLLGAIRQGTALVVERNDRITGYSTTVGYSGHSVAETNDDLKALIAGTSAYAGPGFLVPAHNSELLRWCLENGLRIVKPLTLMSIGLYNEPDGVFLPSVLY